MSTLYFPVVQDCEQGVERWIDIPVDGKRSNDDGAPAPGIRITPRR